MLEGPIIYILIIELGYKNTSEFKLDKKYNYFHFYRRDQETPNLCKFNLLTIQHYKI